MTLSPTTSPSNPSPPKRPRLSLQIKTPANAPLCGKSSTALKTDGVDPTSPTAFNTLSNAYAAAIEAASPRTARPLADAKKPTLLRLETTITDGDDYIHPSQRTQTPGPFSITYPDTPSSAFPDSTPTTAHPGTKPINSSMLPSTASAFTFTPPQSAGSDKPMTKVFTFAANQNTGISDTPTTARPRRVTIGLSIQGQAAPYTHPRALHSILRNSPLPPRTVPTPATPSRMSMRIANRANKKVGYNDPLTQTITTNKYVKSHIDLLAEDSPFSAEEEKTKLETFDVAMACTGDDTRDGGQTPGPFEEMRRRMAESDLLTPGSRKRKRKEKKRKWEWTITTPEDERGESDERPAKTPLTAVRLERTPATAIWRGSSVSSDSETEDGPSTMQEFRNVSVDLGGEDSEMSDMPHSALMDTRDSIEKSVERSCSPQPQ